MQNHFCFGNPAVPIIRDPWFSAPQLLGVWLCRQCYLKSLKWESAIRVPKRWTLKLIEYQRVCPKAGCLEILRGGFFFSHRTILNMRFHRFGPSRAAPGPLGIDLSVECGPEGYLCFMANRPGSMWMITSAPGICSFISRSRWSQTLCASSIWLSGAISKCMLTR